MDALKKQSVSNSFQEWKIVNLCIDLRNEFFQAPLERLCCHLFKFATFDMYLFIKEFKVQEIQWKNSKEKYYLWTNTKKSS